MHRLIIEQTQGLRPGDEVDVSGLYTVTHDPAHAGVDEVICRSCAVAVIWLQGSLFAR
jgi:hypothetical protein